MSSSMQVYWEAVPKTWPVGSKASVTNCVVRPWNNTRSVGGRAESTSWTFETKCMSSAKYGGAWLDKDE